MFTGSNGNSIFLPAAGSPWYVGLDNGGSNGYYWSSTQGPDYDYAANGLYFDSGGARWDDYYGRDFGESVRPVSRK